MGDINWSAVVGQDWLTVWQEISPLLSKLIFNNKMVVIKNLSDATSFDLMICFRKVNRTKDVKEN